MGRINTVKEAEERRRLFAAQRELEFKMLTGVVEPDEEFKERMVSLRQELIQKRVARYQKIHGHLPPAPSMRRMVHECHQPLKIQRAPIIYGCTGYHIVLPLDRYERALEKSYAGEFDPWSND